MAAFSLNLQRKIVPGLVTCGKFDGSHACLVVATPAGNILVHSPHRQPPTNFEGHENLERRLEWNGEVAELQIGRQVISLCTGRLTDDERDILLIGTMTHVLAYQVEENADLFYKEMADGAYSLAVGKLSWLPNNVTIVGGNCSVTVLDSEGTEVYWTVMGDIVRSVAILDFDGDGENELLAGTDDFEIRVLKENSVLWETKETAAVSVLLPLPGRKFAYIVDNGTVGVYEGSQRLWRVKSKHKVVAVRSYDVNGDGAMELVAGWGNGKVDARPHNNGDVLFKIQLASGIAGIVEADYRRTGRPDLVIVSANGEVRGYAAGSIVEIPEPGEMLRKLMAKKHSLQLELRQRAASLQTYLGTKLMASIFTSRGAARLALAAGPGLLIHTATVFAEGVFEGETLVSHPVQPQGELEIELKPSKNMLIDIHVNVNLGSLDAEVLQVVELSRQLPIFCMYEIIPPPDVLPETLKSCGVVFEIAERPKRVIMWLNQCLLLTEELLVAEDGSNGFIEIWLRGMRDDKIHCFRASATGRASIQTEDPNFAGDIVQSLATYLGIQELSSEARFPAEELKLSSALERIKDLREVEARLQADAAGSSALLKNLVIRLEDARILEDAEGMRRRLVQLKTVNGDVMREHEIRMSSTREISITLKELNMGVRYASRLRVGRASTSAVSRCRNAIKNGDPRTLIQALQSG